MTRPMLDDLELQQVQMIELDGDQVWVQHGIPALEGDFLQALGRRASQITLTGVLSGAEVADGLKNLRDKFRAAQPVSFVADIATATRLDKMLIEEMGVRELAGKPSRFEYAFTLREFSPATPTEIIIPPPPPPPPPPPIETSVLEVEVIVEGQPGFDHANTRVRVEGTTDDGRSIATDLTNRQDNVWTADPFPPGNYTATATTADGLTGSGSANLPLGQSRRIVITLRQGRAVANAFIIHYWFDKAFVEPCMRHVLRRVAEFTWQRPDHKLVIVGHTDESGSDQYNQSLSERRSRGAYAYLTFGRSLADADAAVAEWNELRKTRTVGVTHTLNDTWGVRQYQSMLQDLGFYTGPIGDSHTADTDKAVRDFQAANGLDVDGDVGNQTWPVLIRAYMAQDNLAVPESQLMPNASAANGCDHGVVQWLGCGEKMPVASTPRGGCADPAWRPNRRTDLLVVNDDAFPCDDIPQPVTLDIKPSPLSPTGWCLGRNQGEAPSSPCCFLTFDANDETRWLVQPAEPGTLIVNGRIQFEDGTPLANTPYILIAPDGEFMDGEVVCGGQAGRKGTPILGRTDGDGRFSYPAKPKGVGVYTLEIQADVVARSQGQPIAAAKGPVVCQRLDGTADFVVVVVGRAVVSVRPSITLASPVVLVKKPHTNPARPAVTLSVNQAFSGSGEFTRSNDAIRFFDAAVGGSEITFNGVDNVFTDAQLAAGHTIFAEGSRASTAVDDVELRLALTINGTPGLADTATMTAVALTLEICAPRTAPGVDPVPLPEADKINPGRFVRARAADNSHQRAMLIVRQAQPAAFNGELVLVPLNAQVQAFAEADEVPAAGQAPLANPHVIANGGIPANGARFWAEGVTPGNNLGDTGFQLGIRNLDNDGDRVAMTVILLEMVTAANAAIPLVGDDACLMVSKFVTNVNLPDTATFVGPPGANPDPDTFRVQIGGLPPNETPQVRLEVRRGTAVPYTHTFDMVQGVAAGRSTYRLNEHVRLVSNAVDDGHLAHQTARVKLEDVVRATAVFNGQDIAAMQLQVGRPPLENGPKAIRTIDINFITLQGVSSDPAQTVERMSENWAQLAIRFNLVASETVIPVTNVLTIDGTANAAGQLSVDITPQGGAAVTVTTPINNGDTDEQIAQRLAAAISTNPGLSATHHRHDDIFIVMVNRRQEVNFANIASTVATVVFQEPALNFNDTISLLEGSVLGLNFNDDNPSTIDMIAVGRVNVLAAPTDGATGGDFLAANLPGWHNLCILRQEGVDGAAANHPFLAGHEMGHAIFDGSNNLHSPTLTNLFRATVSIADAIDATKRLDEPQNTRARLVSGPDTVPPLLQRK
ncbi:MAG: peptidoglycan-binding protein [Chloroflexi bacterium]|nr:peptidoglycan-binding protein [Chloroflexota bacterium]